MIRGVRTGLGLLMASALLAAAPYARWSDDQLRVGNDKVELRFIPRRGYPFLTRIVDPAGGAVDVEDLGFLLELGEAPVSTFGPKDGTAETHIVHQREVETVLRQAETGVEVRIRWQADDTIGTVRKTFAVRCSHQPFPLLLVARIERLRTREKGELGGLGQPVFVGKRAFFGLEYPAAHNDVSNGMLDLHHFPGKRLSSRWLELKSEIIGVRGSHGTLDEAFAAYVKRVRLPPRTFVHYNSWYDFRRNNMSTRAFIATFDALQAKLTERYGVPLDSFVIDDQYQDKRSIWKTDPKILPEDFGPLARHLQAHGSSLGLWMPLTPNRHNLDLDWGREHGYEITDTGGNYCVSGPKFHAAMRAVIRRHIQTFGLNYYKHDFNNFHCRAPGHGHLPTPEHGFEANVDAYIDLLRYARSLNPHIFLNVTGGMWLSPWWLTVADTVWRGGGDTGHEGLVPYIEQRDDTMTYVDGVLWDRLVKERRQFPPSALMTHGIIYARLCMLGGRDEPLHCWADHVVMYNAPGLMMKELYLTPDLVRDEQWAVLGPTLSWSLAEAGLLVDGRMTHGNPHKGEVYGYVHAGDRRLIWFLRNPAPKPQSVVLPLAAELGGAAQWSILYPYREDHAAAARVERLLAPWQTLVLTARRDAVSPPLALFGDCRYAIRSVRGTQAVLDLYHEGGEAAITVQAAAGVARIRHGNEVVPAQEGTASLSLRFADAGRVTMRDLSPDASGHRNRMAIMVPVNVAEARLGVLIRAASARTMPGPFVLDGKTVKPRIQRGVGWRMFLVDIPPGNHEVGWDVPAVAGGTQPFAPPSCRMGAWLFGRRTLHNQTIVVTLAGQPGEWKRLPTPFAGVNPFRLPIQPEHDVSLRLPGAHVAVTTADLAGAKAAKLRLVVCDVNGGEQYGDKPVLFNGESIGMLPASSARGFSSWQEKIMDLPPAALARIRPRGNEVRLTNPVEDCFKVRDISLAVQLADGYWVETRRENGIYCTHPVGAWKYAEGIPFVDNRSPPITLDFPGETKPTGAAATQH